MKKIIIMFVALFMFNSAYAEEIIKVGITLGLTGKYSRLSQMQFKAYKIFEEDTNTNGGILGRKIKFIILDDKSNPQKSAQLYEGLITKTKVDFIIGPYSSAITEKAAKVAAKYKFPMLCPGAASDSIWKKGNKYVFGLWTTASRYQDGFLKMLYINKIRTVAIIYANDAFSKSLAKGARRSAKKMGHEVKLFLMFKKGKRSLEKEALKAQRSGAEVLMIMGHFNEGVDMKRALINIGWDPKVFYASVAPTLEKYANVLGVAQAENSFSSSQWEPHSRLVLPGAKFFTDKFIEKYNEKPSYHAATAYAAGEILRNAILYKKSFEREKIRDALSIIKTTSIIGKYGVDKNTGEQLRHFPLIIQWQEGQKEIVWPNNIKTSDPRF